MLVFVIDALFVNVYDERQNKIIKKEQIKSRYDVIESKFSKFEESFISIFC